MDTPLTSDVATRAAPQSPAPGPARGDDARRRRARATVVAYTLGGMAGGVLAGAVDAIGGMRGAAVLVLCGSMGLHLVCGAALGALAGVIHPLLPRSLTAVSLVRGATRRVWPRAEVGLHDRCRVVATIWLGALILWVGVEALAGAMGVVLRRVQSPEFAGLATAGIALLSVAAAAAVFAPLHAGLARGLEVVVRRRPGLSALAHPAAHLAVLGVLGGWLSWSALTGELWSGVDLRPVWSVLLLLGPMLVGGELLRRVMRAVPPGRAAAAVGLVLFFGVAAAAAALRSGEARQALASSTGSGRLMIAAMRAPFDGDGDGYARVLGGGDCDDDDPSVHPGAIDEPANGLDEDCSGADAPRPPPPPPPPLPPTEPAALGLEPPYNIVLITVDSMRPDHLGAYGYARPTSPQIDRFAEGAVVFERAYSPSAKTPTAVPSIMSGRYPSELRRDGGHFAVYEPENVFLAEVLAEAGYRTAGFVSHWYFERRYGLGQGFALWQPYTAERGRMEKMPTAETVVVSAVEYLQRTEPGSPFFVWVHLLDPHKDYIDHLEVPRFGEAPIDRYDHEIRYVDTWLAYLFDTLARRGDADRTVVALTSDHGEAFGEHGYRFHGFGLHEHQLRVPLIVSVPGLEPRRVPDRVSLVDLMPTLLDLAGVRPQNPTRPAGVGETLLPLLGGHARAPRPVFAEMPRGPYNAEQLAYIEGDAKLMFSGAGGAWQLFDLAKDPGEEVDRASESPGEVARLRAALNRLRSGLEIREPVERPAP